MPDPLLNNMLRLSTPPSSAAKPQNGSQTAKDGSPAEPDGFAGTLERRIAADARTAARPAREPRHEATHEPGRAQVREARARPGGDRPAHEPADRPTGPRDARTTSARATVREPDEGTQADEPQAPTRPAPGADGAAMPNARTPDPAAESADGGDGNADAVATEVAVPDATVAATLAALLPNVAALPSAPAAASPDVAVAGELPLDTRPPTSGATALEKLIAESAGPMTADGGGDSAKGFGGNDDGARFAEVLDTFAARPWKATVEQIVADATAASAQTVPAGTTVTTASLLQPLQPDAQNALNATGLAPAARTDPAPLPQLPVPTPVGQRVWAEDVGDRVVWMLGRHESKAELVLTPPHLGRLEVSLQLSGEQTSAHFVAATAAARDALEQAMPRLREVLQQAGIQLGQTNVSTSGQQQPQHGAPGRPGGASSNGGDGGAVELPRVAALMPAWSRGGAGRVDTFA
jgi:flagellar hook-length control protein FliK